MTDLEIIEQLNNSPLIKKKYLDNGIVSYNFTREAFYKQEWNEITCRARGLFIDSETNKIVARSYDKFFNIDQMKQEQLDKFHPPFLVSVKYNGYLGLLSYNPKTDDFFIATKSVDYGDYKDWFEKILKDNSKLTPRLKRFLKVNNATFVFEVIDPEHDSHIIEYDSKNLFLLDIIPNEFTFNPYQVELLEDVAKRFDFKTKRSMCIFRDDHTLLKTDAQLSDQFNNVEGIVIKDCCNRMVKVKSEYYKYWKNIRSMLNRIVNGKMSIDDVKNMNADNDTKDILLYAFDNYYSDMSLIDFRKEYYRNKGI